MASKTFSSSPRAFAPTANAAVGSGNSTGPKDNTFSGLPRVSKVAVSLSVRPATTSPAPPPATAPCRGQPARPEGHPLLGLAQGVEGGRVPELGDSDDVPGDRLVHGLAVLADEVRDAPEPLGGTRARVRERLVRAAPAAHDPEHAQAARVRVDKGLEHVGGERAGGGGGG